VIFSQLKRFLRRIFFAPSEKEILSVLSSEKGLNARGIYDKLDYEFPWGIGSFYVRINRMESEGKVEGRELANSHRRIYFLKEQSK